MQDFGFNKPWPLQFGEAVRWQAAAPDQRWIFALREAVRPCVLESRATVVGTSNRRQWWMFRADAVLPGCVPQGSADAQAPDSTE
jgi:hypothetical protein